MRIWRRVVALILVSVVAAAALVPPVAAEGNFRRMLLLDAMKIIARGWGGDELASITCANCGVDIGLDQFAGYDGDIDGAICPYCSKSLKFDSGTVQISRFGLVGGQSRGAGAGGWDDYEDYQIDLEVDRNQRAYLSHDGKYVFACTLSDPPSKYASIVGGSVLYGFSESSSNPGYTVTDVDILPHHWQWYFNSPINCNGYFLIEFFLVGGTFTRITSGDREVIRGGYDAFWRSDEYSAIAGSNCGLNAASVDKYQFYFESAWAKNSGGISYYHLATPLITCLFIADPVKDYAATTNDVVNVENKTIIVNGDTINYDTVYDYGDSYIVYESSGDDAPATIYVKDPVTGEIIGKSWFDPVSGSYYYTDYTFVAPTPTPAPTATPGPGGGDGGDGGDDGSGGSIWDKVAGALADLLGVIGKLIGGLLAGILELLTSVVGSLSQAIPLVNEFSAVIVQLYSFLPAEWQTLLTAAFSIFLILGVVRLFYKG